MDNDVHMVGHDLVLQQFQLRVAVTEGIQLVPYIFAQRCKFHVGGVYVACQTPQYGSTPFYRHREHIDTGLAVVVMV